MQALDKAKEGGRKERMLVRQREQASNGDQVNLDLTYSVSRQSDASANKKLSACFTCDPYSQAHI